MNFDPAADTYESTRGFPAGIGAEVAVTAAGLIGPLPAGAKVLEIGIGTGRIGRPLAATGLSVLGVDLSARMLAELRRLTPADEPAPVVLRGDATRLPLADHSCAAAIGVHIFHLIPDWPAALAEIRRVLRSGGVLLAGHDWRPDDAPHARLMEVWRTIAREVGAQLDHPGADGFFVVQQHLTTRGVQESEHFVGSWTVARSVGQMLSGFERRSWSSTWHIPDEAFSGCLAELRAWANANLGDDEYVIPVTHRFRWQRYQFEPA